MRSLTHFDLWENHGECLLVACFWAREEGELELPSWLCQGWVLPEHPNCPQWYSDKGWAADVTYCDFSRAFEIFSHSVLVYMLGCYSLGGGPPGQLGLEHLSCGERLKDQGWFILEMTRLWVHLTATLDIQRTETGSSQWNVMGRCKTTGKNENKRGSVFSFTWFAWFSGRFLPSGQLCRGTGSQAAQGVCAVSVLKGFQDSTGQIPEQTRWIT